MLFGSKRKWIVILLLAFLLLGFIGAIGGSNGSSITPSPSPNPSGEVVGAQASPINSSSPAASSNPQLLKVTKVVDGDTIQIEGGKTVRYIGIDTPETVDPRRGVQCFGKEASSKNKELVLGKEVRLEKDVSETDRFGRLLRYVYVGELMINETLVKEGFAQASSYPPDVKYQEKFRAAQEDAQKNKKGLWGSCNLTSSATTNNYGTPSNSGTVSGDKDCGDFSTHGEAQAFFISQGGPTSDPHKLDQDKDGIACETLP